MGIIATTAYDAWQFMGAVKWGVIALFQLMSGVPFKRDTLSAEDMQPMRIVFECDNDRVSSMRDYRLSGRSEAERVAQTSAHKASVQQFFESQPHLGISEYDDFSGTAILSWESESTVSLEKRAAFKNAYVTVNGLWQERHYIPNGTFSGYTPQGEGISGRWRRAHDGFEESPEAMEELMSSLPEYYAGSGEFQTR